jgi:uncharacterized protein
LDFQINTPFPGGETNQVKQSMTLDVDELARFHCELADIGLERGHRDDVRVGPFDELLNYFAHRDALLPCIWGQNCAHELVAIDAGGHVAQCDCWVTSYPDYRFGNILQCESLSELLDKSEARRRFFERPAKLGTGGLYPVRLPGALPRRLPGAGLQRAPDPIREGSVLSPL